MGVPIVSRLRYLAAVKRKIANGEKVKIGVFCSGNGDRSPFAQAVLQRAFEKAGHKNVQVFSFGTSVSPDKHHTGPADRTAGHAKAMGFDLSGHRRRHIGDEDVQKDIATADILFAISPSHLDLAAEYTADEAPGAHKHILLKSWTLKGFAEKKEWTKELRRLGGIARGLALKDPYFHPKTSDGEKAFRRDLLEVGRAAHKAAERLIGRRG